MVKLATANETAIITHIATTNIINVIIASLSARRPRSLAYLQYLTAGKYRVVYHYLGFTPPCGVSERVADY